MREEEGRGRRRERAKSATREFVRMADEAEGKEKNESATIE